MLRKSSAMDETERDDFFWTLVRLFLAHNGRLHSTERVIRCQVDHGGVQVRCALRQIMSNGDLFSYAAEFSLCRMMDGIATSDFAVFQGMFVTLADRLVHIDSITARFARVPGVGPVWRRKWGQGVKSLLGENDLSHIDDIEAICGNEIGEDQRIMAEIVVQKMIPLLPYDRLTWYDGGSYRIGAHVETHCQFYFIKFIFQFNHRLSAREWSIEGRFLYSAKPAYFVAMFHLELRNAPSRRAIRDRWQRIVNDAVYDRLAT